MRIHNISSNFSVSVWTFYPLLRSHVSITTYQSRRNNKRAVVVTSLMEGQFHVPAFLGRLLHQQPQYHRRISASKHANAGKGPTPCTFASPSVSVDANHRHKGRPFRCVPEQNRQLALLRDTTVLYRICRRRDTLTSGTYGTMPSKCLL